MKFNRGVAIRYLGHSTFLFTTSKGTRVLIDPWVHGNPACPAECKDLEGVEVILITHGHPDHMADVVSLAQRFRPSIACIYEIALWLGGKGIDHVTGMNKGGTVQLEDVRATMVNAFHSSAIIEDEGKVIYAGEPAGFVIEFEGGFRVYHAGDTCVFGDMKIIGELYRPDLVLLPIGDLFTMDPRQAAFACKLLQASQVIPMHYGTFPVLSGRPETLIELTRGLGTEVIVMQPGEEIS